MSRRALCRDLGAALYCDEVGIEYGLYRDHRGDHRLKSAYQPVYAPRGGHLAPVALAAFLAPQRLGRPVPRGAFLDGVPAAERPFVDAMGRLLHLANFRNAGAEGLDLLLDWGPGAGERPLRTPAEIRLMAQRLDEWELHAGMLVCAVSAAADMQLSARLARELRRNGLGVAIGGFGAGPATEELLGQIRPDIVRIDGGWFCELCRHAAAARLLRPLLDLLHRQGARVLVDGIETPPQLLLALESGADLLQGALLAPPAPAGALLRREPLAIDSLSGAAGGKVVSLFGRAPG